MSFDETSIDDYIEDCFKKLKPIVSELEDHIHAMEKYGNGSYFTSEQKRLASELADLMYFISET